MKSSAGKSKNLCDKDDTNIFSTHAAVCTQKKPNSTFQKEGPNTMEGGSVPWKQRSAAPSGEAAEVGCQEGQGAERQQTTIAYVSYQCLGQTTWNLLATPLSSLWVKSCLCVEPVEHLCAKTSEAAAISLSASGSVLITKASHNKGLKQSARWTTHARKILKEAHQRDRGWNLSQWSQRWGPGEAGVEFISPLHA